ncbi:radical SAM protein [Maribellus sediminis]|uniref:radical SAM protein n=1 Tax=Maribellus sediminis TaxID=2696285 RepID=UPI00142F81AB|nr:radical SAM protein [Maribellus sediminis]
MDAYLKWQNSLVNKNKAEIAGWEELSWLNGYNSGEAQEQRDKLIRKLKGSLLFKETKPYYNQISNGCKLCGLGQWSCLFITGKCNASCFYCPTSQLSDDVPTTQNLSFPDARAYAEYVNHFNFKGVSFSGGEPLLFFERTLEYLKQVRKHCNPEIYTWMYTNGILADERKFRKLAAAGLNEVRFDIGATAYKLDKVRLAKGIIPNVTIEIPAVPEEKERLKTLLPQMIEAGVTNLNLHQLRLTKHNYRNLSKKDYTYVFAEHPLVLESELAALEILDYAREHNLKIGVNYCSFYFKNRFQKAGFRSRLAHSLADPDDVFTQNGYIREFTGDSIGYKSIRIFDAKPELYSTQEFAIHNKTFYFMKEQVMKTTLLDPEYRIKVEQLINREPVEIPSDPLLFRIWQLEYIENGLREY